MHLGQIMTISTCCAIRYSKWRALWEVGGLHYEKIPCGVQGRELFKLRVEILRAEGCKA